MDEIRVLSPTAILGYGFPADSLKKGMERNPHIIAVDAGSTDGGPHLLGSKGGGSGFDMVQFSKALEADLRPLVKAALSADIPLVIGSAGGAGGNDHLAGMEKLLKTILAQEGLQCRVAFIQAEMERDVVREKLRTGKITPLGPVPDLTMEDVDRATRIVAQMGVEPFIEALRGGAQIIMAGRASDPSMFAALPILKGVDHGLSLHMGKILECGAIAAEPGSGGDVMLGTIREDHFTVEPMNPDRRCTVKSVAAHSLYEASSPWRLDEPGGVVDLTDVLFEPVNDRVVRVSGSRYRRDSTYRLKLEGAEMVGYRTICIAGVRDPSVIRNLDGILEDARRKTDTQFDDMDPSLWQLHFKVYGKDGVMGNLEPERSTPHEAGLVIETIASDQGLANSICMFVHALVLHYGFPGRTCTAGNLAFPFSPQDIPAGPVCRFSIYHLMEVDDPLVCFPIKYAEA